MRFQFEDRKYFLQFERNHKKVDVFKNREKVVLDSKYPFTTVTLYEIMSGTYSAGRKTIASATVGCHPGDTYSNAKGRLFALKELSSSLRRLHYPHDFVAAVWNAYQHRADAPSKPGVIDGQVVSAETVMPPADVEPGVI